MRFPTELFWADQTYALAEEIGKYAQRINAADFGELFGSLQLVLSERQTLAMLTLSILWQSRDKNDRSQ
jgi:hypothetical protein